MPSTSPVTPLARFFLQEDLNFLVTNRLPRRAATRLMGWFSRIESRPLTRLSLTFWKAFAGDLRLDEARESDFPSLQACFTRELKPGVRPIHADPRVVVSPCDAIIGAHGAVRDTQVIQAKGLSYSVAELLGDAGLAQRHADGLFATLRLKSSMYHRFHAPCDGQVRSVRYFSGETWNVNPIALKRVERLFCKNERAVIEYAPTIPGTALTLVPVAAILVASMQFTFIPTPLTLAHRGRTLFPCDARFAKGDELGHFEAGSTIILLASGPFRFCSGVEEGAVIRYGMPLLEPQSATVSSPEGP